MTPVFLLLIVITASFLCVRAGAIALQLTGMTADNAYFQALSAFTNTGFTTRASEEIIRVPIRRRIVTVLIILGHAGTVSVIAAFATSLLQKDFAHTALNLLAIGGGVYLIYRIAIVRGITSRVAASLRKWLLKHYSLEAPSLEEMLKITEGFGVVRIVVSEASPIINQPLQELGLKLQKIQILSIKRGSEVLAIPKGTDCLMPGDELTCYGDMDAVTQMFSWINEKGEKQIIRS